jgi:hypothetical protein
MIGGCCEKVNSFQFHRKKSFHGFNEKSEFHFQMDSHQIKPQYSRVSSTGTGLFH